MPFSIFILIDLTALQKYLPSEKDLRTNLACTVQSAKQTFPFLQDTPMAIGGQEEDGTFMVFKNVYINPWNFIPIHSSVACHFYTACISNLLPVYHIHCLSTLSLLLAIIMTRCVLHLGIMIFFYFGCTDSTSTSSEFTSEELIQLVMDADAQEQFSDTNFTDLWGSGLPVPQEVAYVDAIIGKLKSGHYFGISISYIFILGVKV